MANLFWKTSKETKSLLTRPFNTEDEFEKEIFNTPEILEDIFLIKRQIKGGKKKGIPDIVGIDNDGNICIIEMKNVKVDSSIIPQVLEYAFWAETNPDSIKSLWLESENKPDELTVSFDNFEVRIIIIAPDILRSTLEIVDKINYPVDLIEIKRWIEDENSLFLVNKLEIDTKTSRIKTTKGLEIYDADFYKTRYNKKSAVEFLRYSKELSTLVKKNNWNLELKFNKHYCGFKAGFFNVFGIGWVGSKTFAFFLKLAKNEAEKLSPRMTKYQHQWKQAVYYIDPENTRVEDYEKLFEKAYKKRAGE